MGASYTPHERDVRCLIRCFAASTRDGGTPLTFEAFKGLWRERYMPYIYAVRAG